MTRMRGGPGLGYSVVLRDAAAVFWLPAAGVDRPNGTALVDIDWSPWIAVVICSVVG